LQTDDDLDAGRDLPLDQHSLEAVVAHRVVRPGPHLPEFAAQLARRRYAELDRPHLGLVEHAVGGDLEHDRVAGLGRGL